MDKTLISAEVISRKHNISYQTVNYYTTLGFLTVRRREGNSRLYGQDEVKRNLTKINKLKDLGYSLRLIREILRKER